MSAKLQVDKYFAALQRLIDRGERVSKTAVAIEAGSKPGCIKPSRPAYERLIYEIDQAAKTQQVAKALKDPTAELQRDIEQLTQRLDEALEREVCLLHEVYSLREENRQLRTGRPVVVRTSGSSSPSKS